MKYFLIFVLFLATSCVNDQDIIDISLIGKWQLVEQVTNNASGGGDYAPITSDKTIEFFQDGTFKSNGTLCGQDSNASENIYQGNYVTSIASLRQNGCSFDVTYSIRVDKLILSFPCFERCGQKYIKAD